MTDPRFATVVLLPPLPGGLVTRIDFTAWEFEASIRLLRMIR
jgi:hypothetical protein